MLKTLIWTKAGLARLGEIIRRSREKRGMDLRRTAHYISDLTGISVGHNTLGDIERGTREPKYNTLAAIAASGIVEYKGKVLNIFDFIAIASEDDVEVTPMRRLVEDHLQKEGITLEKFAKICRVAIDDMQTVLDGGETEDYTGDLILIASRLTNPATGVKFRTYLELLDYCGMARNQQTNSWELSHKVESA